MSRCTGHCCRCFYIGVPIDDLIRPDRNFRDGRQIHDMLIPLGVMTFLEVREKFGASYPPMADADAKGEWYTCKNLQPNGDCGIYETRPGMCHSYPDRGVCEWAGCTRKGTCNG